MSPAASALVWFRDDLRLADHAALAACAASPLLCVYVFDEESEGVRALGGAARWWLRHSLASLSAALEKKGGRLDILRGRGDELIPALAAAAGVGSVCWLRRFGAAEQAVDRRAKQALRARGIAVSVYEGALLHDPERFLTSGGSPYRVFTPFWRALRQQIAPPALKSAPARLGAAAWPKAGPKRIALDALGLLPTRPDWAGGLRETWRPGEAQARSCLSNFVGAGLKRYAAARDVPSAEACSRLSPHLRFGEISVNQVWRAVDHGVHEGAIVAADADKFLSEIGWREFSYHQLVHFPDLARRNYNSRFDAFDWKAPARERIARWRRGETGYPIVDAGMRELWRTGYMHNRVRLIVASFLVKDLLIDWRIGEQWFWDTLCDADAANNPANWQWAAGSGADAAPYFRVFNPVLQGKKFDPDGAYVRRYVPELAKAPTAWIHEPWKRPTASLFNKSRSASNGYPSPMVDHAEARARALAAFKALDDAK